MRLKVYLHMGRDVELIAIRFNPAFDFSGLAREVLRAQVRGKAFYYSLPVQAGYVPKPLVCSIYLDERSDADIISYLENLIIPKTAFVRNAMVRSIQGNINFIYSDKKLKTAMQSYQREQQTRKKKLEIERKLRKLKERKGGLSEQTSI